ncbi:zinc-ribbon domain-containing protein [Pseudorhodoferax aquiterrae]|uniref:zinc-ribbon domain-containing protein n=1 Tax=Pseudorhodoferax aquiterrae TaxID=747304 RepID=UPI003570A747
MVLQRVHLWGHACAPVGVWNMGLLRSLLGGGHHGSNRGHGHGHVAPPCDADRMGNYAPPAAAHGASVCPSCRTTNASSARFCQNCGASFAQKVCGKCRANLATTAKFCAECGTAAP